MFGKNKNNIKAIILRKVNDNYIKLGEKNIKNTDEHFYFEKHTFPVKLNVSFYDKTNAVLFYDYDDKEGKQLSFQSLKIPIPLTDLDNLVHHNIVVGFLSKINKAFEKMEMGGTILKYIVVLVCGALGGYVVGSQFSGSAKIIFMLPQIILGMLLGAL